MLLHDGVDSDLLQVLHEWMYILENEAFQKPLLDMELESVKSLQVVRLRTKITPIDTFSQSYSLSTYNSSILLRLQRLRSSGPLWMSSCKYDQNPHEPNFTLLLCSQRFDEQNLEFVLEHFDTFPDLVLNYLTQVEPNESNQQLTFLVGGSLSGLQYLTESFLDSEMLFQAVNMSSAFILASYDSVSASRFGDITSALQEFTMENIRLKAIDTSSSSRFSFDSADRPVSTTPYDADTRLFLVTGRNPSLPNRPGDPSKSV